MENLIERIANKLAEIFPEITIYAENQKSGFDVPSFYIEQVATHINNRFFNIQDRTVSFQVVYFANPEEPNLDIAGVESLLLDNFVTLNDYATVRNREFNTNSEQETLTMNFDLLLNMYKVEHIPLQRSLDINERTNN